MRIKCLAKYLRCKNYETGKVISIFSLVAPLSPDFEYNLDKMEIKVQQGRVLLLWRSYELVATFVKTCSYWETRGVHRQKLHIETPVRGNLSDMIVYTLRSRGLESQFYYKTKCWGRLTKSSTGYDHKCLLDGQTCKMTREAHWYWSRFHLLHIFADGYAISMTALLPRSVEMATKHWTNIVEMIGLMNISQNSGGFRQTRRCQLHSVESLRYESNELIF